MSVFVHIFASEKKELQRSAFLHFDAHSCCCGRVFVPATSAVRSENALSMCVRWVWGVVAAAGMRAFFFSLFSASRKLHGTSSFFSSLAHSDNLCMPALSHARRVRLCVCVWIYLCNGAPFDHYHNYYIEHEIKIFFTIPRGFFLLVVVVIVVVVCVCVIKEGRIRTFRVCFSVQYLRSTCAHRELFRCRFWQLISAYWEETFVELLMCVDKIKDFLCR